MQLRLALAGGALALAALAQAQNNLQNLLAALTQGSEVTLITALASGGTEVTSFRPALPMSPADAAAAVERAREELASLGVAQPSGRQLATALAGGTVDIPTGRTQMRGTLPQGVAGGTIRSQVIAAGTLPQVAGSAPITGPRSAAEIAQAVQIASQQLAAAGITNPTPQQMSAALASILAGGSAAAGGTRQELPPWSSR